MKYKRGVTRSIRRVSAGHERGAGHSEAADSASDRILRPVHHYACGECVPLRPLGHYIGVFTILNG